MNLRTARRFSAKESAVSLRRLAPAALLFAALAVAPAARSQQFQPQPEPKPDTPQERFDTLTLDGSNLHALEPIVGEKDVLPGFTRELLRVQWRYQDPIDLYVIRPTGVAKPPVILFLYSFPTDASRFRSNQLCENLTRNGFAAVGFVSALTGQRYHDRPMREWFVSELQESLATSAHDVQMVINYLQTRDDLDASRVGIFGQGSGGTIAILAAGVDPRIKAVDTLDPWADWPAWLAKSPEVPEEERPRYLTPQFLAKVAPYDPVQRLPRFTDRPLRVQETLFTTTLPEEARKKLLQSLPAGATSIQYKDKEEYTEKAGSKGKMLDWLDAALASTAPTH